MDPQLLRMFMHVASLMMAVIVAWALPFSPLVNVAIAGAVWLVDGFASEIIFQRIAASHDRTGAVRDRRDSPSQ